MDKERYAQSIRKQKRDGKTSLRCVICGEDHPAALEMHHIFGRGNSGRVEPLCKNCHAAITAQQNKIPPQKRKGRHFESVTAAALLHLIAERMAENAYEKIEHGENCS